MFIIVIDALLAANQLFCLLILQHIMPNRSDRRVKAQASQVGIRRVASNLNQGLSYQI